jgi:hypothetical protein
VQAISFLLEQNGEACLPLLICFKAHPPTDSPVILYFSKNCLISFGLLDSLSLLVIQACPCPTHQSKAAPAHLCPVRNKPPKADRVTQQLSECAGEAKIARSSAAAVLLPKRLCWESKRTFASFNSAAAFFPPGAFIAHHSISKR